MKTFNNLNEAFDWINSIVKNTNVQSTEKIAKQIYEDSKEYTYIDTQTMYDSGSNSEFKSGYVIMRAPQVRWLYYTTGIKPHKNQNAVPLWFERTKQENIKNYVKIYSNLFNKNKK